MSCCRGGPKHLALPVASEVAGASPRLRYRGQQLLWPHIALGAALLQGLRLGLSLDVSLSRSRGEDGQATPAPALCSITAGAPPHPRLQVARIVLRAAHKLYKSTRNNAVVLHVPLNLKLCYCASLLRFFSPLPCSFLPLLSMPPAPGLPSRFFFLILQTT